jgi:dihydrofolate synthase/folylpolyglutamate synthase
MPTPTLLQEAALRFLVDRIDYERTLSMPSSEEAFKLDRMRELLARLGNPQKEMRVVHVAGTKGKGSTAAMTAAVLTAAGFRTGLFTSPHLDRIEERIAIDGRCCSENDLAELLNLIRPVVEAMDQEKGSELFSHGPTYFEIITAAAWCHFARRKVDVAVLEVGLGGRLDSTNVCEPSVSIITSISFDHVKQLGNTLAAIAAEKAGIIKPGVPVVSGVAIDEARDVIRRIARENSCRLAELGVDFDFTYHPPLHLEQVASLGRLEFQYGKQFRHDVAIGLLGRHQAANAALVLAVVEELRHQGWSIPDAAVQRGLAEVRWPARVEVVSRRPTVVLDAAHNAASIESLLEVLAESFAARRRILVFATTQEKDLRGMLERMAGHFDDVLFTRYLNNPRSVPPEELRAISEGLPKPFASQIHLASTPAEAWDEVLCLAAPDDLVCITGSFFFAAEIRREFTARPFPPN